MWYYEIIFNIGEKQAMTPITQSLQSLGSFYSCNDLEGSSRTMVGTITYRSYKIWSKYYKLEEFMIELDRVNKICTNWAYHTEFYIATHHVYVSGAPSGPCYDVTGSLMTRATMTTGVIHAFIPLIQVTCTNSNCITQSIKFSHNTMIYKIPELTVNCAGSVCITSPIDITNTSSLKLSTTSFTCNIFPCDISVGRTVSDLGAGTYATASSIYNNYYYLPSQLVTCSGSACSIDEITIDLISLYIPSQPLSCTNASVACNDIPELDGLIDSAGNSFTLDSRVITCSNFICTAESKTLSGTYNFNAPTQTVQCNANACSVPAMFLNAEQNSFVNIPALDVGMVGATAGSLYAICMYHLDHQSLLRE